MSLKYWLLVPLIGGLCMLLAIGLRLRRNGKVHLQPILAANLALLERLPSYRKVKRRSRLLQIIRIGLLFLIIVSMATVLARPQQHTKFVDVEKTRDVVVCMDISGSMSSFAAQALQALETIVEADRTDRFSIVLFQNAPFTALPLTRDTATLKDRAREISDGLASSGTNLWKNAGMQANGTGGTDLAAGMQGCLNRFDQLEIPRTRHLVFLSDFKQEANSQPERAAEAVAKANVHSHYMYPASFDADNLAVLAKITGAQTYGLADPQATQAIVNEVYETIVSDRNVEAYIAVDSPYLALAWLAGVGFVWFGFEWLYWGGGRRL